jgi:hypothetical protein
VWSVWVALGAIVVFLLLANRFARGKKEHTYLVFLTGGLALLAVSVLGNYYLDFRIIGEPGRLFPELDLLMILFAVELLRRLWLAPGRFRTARSILTVTIVIAAWSTSYNYVSKRRTIYRTDYNLAERPEWQMQDWVAKNMPQARAMAAGSIRFWYNVWNDLPQLGGGSEQGLTNPLVMNSQWEILLGPDYELALLWMQVFGVDAVLVNEKHSKEWYHDHQYPQKFAGKLRVLNDDKAGNVIYSVPRRYQSLARVVDRSLLASLPEVPGNGELPQLRAWRDAVENGPDAPTSTRWEGTDKLVVQAPVAANQSVLVQVSYDPNWRAYSGAQRLPVRNTKLGMVLVDAPAGTSQLSLIFPTPLSNQVGRVVTLLTLLVIVGLIWIAYRRSSSGSG